MLMTNPCPWRLPRKGISHVKLLRVASGTRDVAIDNGDGLNRRSCFCQYGLPFLEDGPSQKRPGLLERRRLERFSYERAEFEIRDQFSLGV